MHHSLQLISYTGYQREALLPGLDWILDWILDWTEME